MSMLEQLKVLLNLQGNDKEELLLLLLHRSESYVLRFCGRKTLPKELEGAVVDLAVLRYNRLGSEGLASEGYAGVSQSWELDVSPGIRHQLLQYRRVRMI